jgi:hypothetical protein
MAGKVVQAQIITSFNSYLFHHRLPLCSISPHHTVRRTSCLASRLFTLPLLWQRQTSACKNGSDADSDNPKLYPYIIVVKQQPNMILEQTKHSLVSEWARV